MESKLFIVKVATLDHDADLLDHFAKHLAYKFAGSAYHVIDVQEAVMEPATVHRVKQITLTNENFKTLTACIRFCLEDLQVTEGRIVPDVTLEDVANLSASVAICTKESSA